MRSNLKEMCDDVDYNRLVYESIYGGSNIELYNQIIKDIYNYKSYRTRQRIILYMTRIVMQQAKTFWFRSSQYTTVPFLTLDGTKVINYELHIQQNGTIKLADTYGNTIIELAKHSFSIDFIPKYTGKRAVSAFRKVFAPMIKDRILVP